ncbi:MAG: Veg family protein [Limnochordia bacterium]|nr:Veg family protein [Limnochordia bacterium]MDD2629909.1 Veg family protein [Limnochordia bacterium]MDD4519062.1 Veg family protein [Limnochordia bacterium]
MTAKGNSLQAIRHDLQNYVGKPVRLRANRGRKRIMEAKGILEKTYPNLFVVRLDDGSPVQRMSYTYADVLTETVEIKFDDRRIGVS